jgi:hypothetical protein
MSTNVERAETEAGNAVVGVYFGAATVRCVNVARSWNGFMWTDRP